MSNKKQTAVEWLVDKVIEYQQKDLKISKNFDRLLIANAKEMEKQQIIDAYGEGDVNGIMENIKMAEQYYNETFNT